MVFKKRKKVTRMRGSHTHSRGAKKKARGSGHRGGIGMSGTGKRGDQKKSLILKKFGNKYFGKNKVSRGAVKKNLPVITLKKINTDLGSFLKKGVAKENNGVYEFNFAKYKVIGNFPLEFKARIEVGGASKGTLESVKKSGGEIIILKGSKTELKN